MNSDDTILNYAALSAGVPVDALLLVDVGALALTGAVLTEAALTGVALALAESMALSRLFSRRLMRLSFLSSF